MSRLVLALLVALAGCARPPPAPVAAPRYVVGTPYELGGLWSYPNEEFARTETGLATVLPDRRAGRRTPNGEVFDPSALVAAHRTLQLPAIVTVTNLENGRALAVRVNDRGPERPGRLLGLSRRAALLLGVPEGGATQVRVTVDPGPSRALAAALPSDAPRGPDVAVAPAGNVAVETLVPPEGARAAERVRAGAPRRDLATIAEAEGPPPDRLPETVTQGYAAPGLLMLEIGRFFRRDLAQRQAARVGARVDAVGSGRQTQWRAVLGPFPTVAAADAAVAQVVAAGLPEVRLVVE